MRRSFLAGGVIGLVLGAASAQATVVVYTDEPTFQAALGGVNLAIEGYESVTPYIYPSLELGAMSVHNQGLGVNVLDDPRYATEGENGISWGLVVHGNITFDFASPINAFATDLKGVGYGLAPSHIRASLNGGTFFDVFVDVTGGPTDVRFLGLIDTAASFSSVTLTESPDALSSIGVDRTQYGLVPEPGTASLLALGLALLGAQRRRRCDGAASPPIRRSSGTHR